MLPFYKIHQNVYLSLARLGEKTTIIVLQTKGNNDHWSEKKTVQKEKQYEVCMIKLVRLVGNCFCLNKTV